MVPSVSIDMIVLGCNIAIICELNLSIFLILFIPAYGSTSYFPYLIFQ